MKRAVVVSLMLLMLFPAISQGDDTEIYGTVTVSLQPNVLIIFDTSGSMATQDVPGDPYDPAVTYSGPYNSNKVYRRYYYSWDEYISHIDYVDCQDVKDALLSDGYCYKRFKRQWISGAYHGICGGTYKQLRLGNFMNYEASGVGAYRSRIDVAKEVISDLINETENVRFGLFRFNSTQGGRLVEPCGTSKATLLTSVAALPASDWDPPCRNPCRGGALLCRHGQLV